MKLRVKLLTIAFISAALAGCMNKDDQDEQKG